MLRGSSSQGATLVHVTTSTSATEVFAGIDWGGSFHQICLIDEPGQVLRQQRVQHNAAGLDELDRLLAGRQAQLRGAGRGAVATLPSSRFPGRSPNTPCAFQRNGLSTTMVPVRQP